MAAIGLTEEFSNYEISNLDQLENSAANLAKNDQQIANCTRSLEYIIKAVQQNWENESGEDIQSILLNLNNNISTLRDEIEPIIRKYIETLNQIVAETRLNQSKNI